MLWKEICDLAKQYKVDQVILLGSRARGDNDFVLIGGAYLDDLKFVCHCRGKVKEIEFGKM